MGTSNFPFSILLICVFFCFFVESHEEGSIVVEISNKGLDSLKDLLIQKAESSLVPIQLPQIEKTVHIPLLGNVDILLSSIVIHTINVTSSTVKTGSSGIVLNVSGATADMTMVWKYSYRAKYLPISVSDHGNASIQVEGMEVGLTLSLKAVEGSLKVSLLDCGCYVDNLYIQLIGGTSWLYQGLVDAFEGKIESAVESAVSDKLSDGVNNLDSQLQSLPKEIPVTKTASLNVTFVDDPVLKESSVDVELNGLFSPNAKTTVSGSGRRLLKSSSSCDGEDKMVKVSVRENVLESASSVYFEQNKMHWTVRDVPDEEYLNTSWWKDALPQLYNAYPDHDISLDVSVSSFPVIEVENKQIKVKAPVDVVINVLDEEQVIPVACISIAIDISTSPEVSGNALAGSLQLNDFKMSLSWSNIGDIHIAPLQTLALTTLRTVVVPYINLKLYEGYAIPSFHGYGLEDAQILCTDDSWIVMCSDITPVEQSFQSYLISVS